MNRSFFYRHFKNWIKINRSKFLIEPYILRVRKNEFRVYFRGLGNCYFLNVNKYGDFSLLSRYHSSHFADYSYEWVADFDYVIENEGSGFYCKLCRGGGDRTFDLFQTREEFVVNHSYIPFLEWINKHAKFLIDNKRNSLI